MLKKENYLAFMFFILFAAIFIVMSNDDPAITGFATANTTNQSDNVNTTSVFIPTPKLQIELDSKTFDEGKTISGIVKLNISGRVTNEDVVTLSVNNQTSTRNLVDIIKTLNAPHKDLQTIYQGENPQPVKFLTFDSGGSQFVGVKVRSKSNILGFTLDIEGKENNGQFPTFPKLTIGTKTLYNDWEYYGDLSTYNNNPTKAATLELTSSEEQIIVTNSPKTFYCEKINLPESRAFKLAAKYKKTDPNFGDLKMKILDGSNFNEIQTGNCDLPEDESLDWHSCEAVLDRTLGGDHLICFYSSKDQSLSGLAQLSIDPETTPANPGSKGYICNENFDCNQVSATDYYIQVFEGIYPKSLRTKEKFSNWTTSPNIGTLSFNNHLNICEPYDFSKTFCMVPLRITSDSAGKIELSNLNLEYTKDGSTFSPVTEFNDLTYSESALELTKEVILQIPILVFGLAAPGIKTALLKAETSSGLTAEKSFDVNLIQSKLTLDPIPATLNRIAVSKSLITRLKSDELTSALGLTAKIDAVSNDLTTFENKINNIKLSNNLTLVEKEIQALGINDQLDEILKQIPKNYNVKTSFKFSPATISYKELSEEIPVKHDISYQRALLDLQDEISVDATARIIEIVYSESPSKTATSITKIIKPKTPLSNVEIIEKIPKTMAKSVSEIGFDTKVTALKDDPIVKFVLSDISPDNPGKITYAVYKEVLSSVEDTATLYIPTDISNDLIGLDCGNNYCNFLEDYTSCPEDCLCGNNACDLGEEATCPSDCKKFPLALVISLITLFILAGFGSYYYIVIYRNPEKREAFNKKLKKLPIINIFVKEKKLFKNPDDLINLKIFVKNASVKGFSKLQIRDSLRKKGWNEEQIEEALKP